MAFAILSFIFGCPNKSNADWIPDFLQSDAELFCQTCEEILRDRLKSPSSYKRLNCSGPHTQVVSKQKYLSYYPQKKWSNLPSYEKREIEGGKLRITEFSLKYEASNSYGASISNYALCDVMHSKDNGYIPSISSIAVRIDGLTSTGWALERFIRAQEAAQ
jgi:hypothetical protein